MGKRKPAQAARVTIELDRSDAEALLELLNETPLNAAWMYTVDMVATALEEQLQKEQGHG